MRLVLDTNIVVSGLIWGGIPRRLLDLRHNGHVTLFTNNVPLDRAQLGARLESEHATKRRLTPPFC